MTKRDRLMSHAKNGTNRRKKRRGLHWLRASSPRKHKEENKKVRKRGREQKTDIKKKHQRLALSGGRSTATAVGKRRKREAKQKPIITGTKAATTKRSRNTKRKQSKTKGNSMRSKKKPGKKRTKCHQRQTHNVCRPIGTAKRQQ
jgi:hypothetical protein